MGNIRGKICLGFVSDFFLDFHKKLSIIITALKFGI